MAAKTNIRTIVIGLTGSIGMGKSTAAKILSKFDIPIYCADEATHNLMKKDKATIKKITAVFPEVMKKREIDRKSLGSHVFANPTQLKKLEKIIHPLEKKEEIKFIKMARKKKYRAAVLEVPLLFETGREKLCDIVICVTASQAQQKTRVLSRKGMNAQKFKKIIALQLSDKEKRQKSDFVVNTGKSLIDTKRQLSLIWKNIKERPLDKCAK